MHRDQLSDTLRCRRSGIDRRTDCRNVTGNFDKDQPAAGPLFSNKRYVGRFGHRVGCFNRTDKTLCLYHAERILKHRNLSDTQYVMGVAKLFFAFRKNQFHIAVWTRNDMNRH